MGRRNGHAQAIRYTVGSNFGLAGWNLHLRPWPALSYLSGAGLSAVPLILYDE
jgi:hypothetical protein